MDIYKLNQELCDMINECNNYKKTLSIESPLYAKIIKLESKINDLQNEIYNYYHPPV